jgi:hypothetical protein
MAITDEFLLNRSDSFTLTATTEASTDLALTASAPSSGNIRGTITNAVGGAAIAGATVKLRTETGTGDPVAHTATNAAGNYIFPDIPTETYKVSVAIQGFVTPAYTSVTLQSGQTIVVNFTLTPESRSRNVVYGTITDQSSGAVIFDACVTLIPNITTLADLNMGKSNASGQFMLDQIPDSTQNLGASAAGFYLSDFRSITISGGTILRSDEVLQPYSLPRATVNGVITNQANGSPIANAFVGLYSLDPGGIESLQQITFTDSNGFYIFGRASAGTYVVKAKLEQGL